jgi:hypothetical protein
VFSVSVFAQLRRLEGEAKAGRTAERSAAMAKTVKRRERRLQRAQAAGDTVFESDSEFSSGSDASDAGDSDDA